MVQRRDLERLLDAGVQNHRATAVIAPSGFGKTVAVAQWAEKRQRETPGSVSWLTLTDTIGDLNDFLRGVFTALLHAARDGGDHKMLAALTSMFEAAAPEGALAALAALEPVGPVVVVIDDLHKGAAALRDPGFADFVEYGPDWLRLILISVEAHDRELGRLRVHRKLAGIGARELSFTAAEIVEVASLVDEQLDAESAADILSATDGWPGAVRLAVVSGTGGPTPVAADELTEYIRTSVLSRLPAHLADFVLAATVCNRVDEGLASVLSGRDDAGQLLAECVAAGLFVERFGGPEGSESVVYQWHSMFSMHCRRIVRLADPGRWRLLNRRAAQWLSQQYPLEAIVHAIATGDPAVANEIVADHWLELLVQSRWAALDAACVRIRETFGDLPKVEMVRACCRGLAGDRVGADLLFARATAMVIENPSRRIDFVRSMSRVLLTDSEAEMMSEVDVAAAMLADRDAVSPRVYACALFILGWAQVRLRLGADRGSGYLEAAVHECRALGMVEVAQRAAQYSAFAFCQAGEFTRSVAALAELPTTSEGSFTPDGAGVEVYTSGWIKFWRGDLSAARDDFLELSAVTGQVSSNLGRMMLSFAAAALGDPDTMRVAELAADQIPAGSTGLPWLGYRNGALAALAAARGSGREALRLSATLVEVHNIPAVSVIAAATCRRLGDAELARLLAERTLIPGVPGYIAAAATLTLALIDWEQGRTESAHRLLETVLASAATESVLYPFIENTDAPCRELLAAHTSYTAYGDFLAECRLACERAGGGRAAPVALTEREREVLVFLRTPMTADEIATNMSVSVNTLKTHQRSIYRKLGAANRREAIRLAPR